MPNDTEKILSLISGNLTLFNKQMAKQTKAMEDLADAVKNQKITVNAPDVKVNLSDLKVTRLDIPPVTLPEIKVPAAHVTVDIPKIVVPKPEVTVNVAQQVIPAPNVTVQPTPVIFPKEMEVGGFAAFAKSVIDAIKSIVPFSIFDEVDRLNPVPVILVKPDGTYLENFGGGGSGVYIGGGGGGGNSRLSVMSSGKVVNVSAGTLVQFSTVTKPCSQVIVTAHLDNLDVVVVGDSTIVAAAATRQGVQLVAGQAAVFNIDDLNKLYLDAVSTGDKVMYTYLA